MQVEVSGFFSVDLALSLDNSLRLPYMVTSSYMVLQDIKWKIASSLLQHGLFRSRWSLNTSDIVKSEGSHERGGKTGFLCRKYRPYY